jgi:hypothetical protein
MSGYGRRYLTANKFSAYCSDLNVHLRPFDSELEFYEREGVLLPVARVIKPDEYVIERKKLEQQPEGFWRSLPKWGELERLLYGYSVDRRIDPDKITDADLCHPFDRELEGHNRFLIRPALGDFKPWKSFRIGETNEQVYEVETAVHYYHYWQVYQVYAIQKKYPIFAKHPEVFKYLKDDAKDEMNYLWPGVSDAVLTLNGKSLYFDALSFYIEMYTAEEARTSAPIGGVKRLNDEQLKRYQSRLKGHAKTVLQRYERYGLTTSHLYQFLVDILDLRGEYQRDEHAKLADELEKDIVFLTRFIAGITDQSFDQITEEVGKRGTFWTKQEFRHLDRAVQVLDYARDTFERVMNDYNQQFPEFNINSTEVNELLRFIETAGLFIIPYTIFTADKALNDPKAFRKTSLYMGMKNLTTGLECLLREIAKKIPNVAGSVNTLDELINAVFKRWCGQFGKERAKRQSPTQPSDFIRNIRNVDADLLLDQQIDGHAIRVFLVAYWARNLTGHYYTLEDDLYGDLYSIVYRAIYYALLYTWKYAIQTQKGWVI